MLTVDDSAARLGFTLTDSGAYILLLQPLHISSDFLPNTRSTKQTARAMRAIQVGFLLWVCTVS